MAYANNSLVTVNGNEVALQQSPVRIFYFKVWQKGRFAGRTRNFFVHSNKCFDIDAYACIGDIYCSPLEFIIHLHWLGWRKKISTPWFYLPVWTCEHSMRQCWILRIYIKWNDWNHHRIFIFITDCQWIYRALLIIAYEPYSRVLARSILVARRSSRRRHTHQPE